MSLEAQIADLNSTLKRLCSILEAQQGGESKITNLDMTGKLEDVEQPTEEADNEPAVETEVEEKPVRKKKTRKKVAKKPAAKEEESDDSDDDSGDEAEISFKDVSPLLHQLTAHYAENKFKGDKAKGKQAVLDFMEEHTEVRKLKLMSQDQLKAFAEAVKEELA